MARAPRRRRAGPRTLGSLAEVSDRTIWSLVVWSLFTILILGPLLTVLAFSFISSVFADHTTLTGKWYARLFAEPALYGPLVRSFEVAFVVVAIQLVLGTLISYATLRRKIWGAQTLDAMSNLTIALPSVVVGLALLAFYGPFGPVRIVTDFVFGNPLALTWTLWIVVFAHVLETFPYMVRTVGSVLQRMNPHLESAARSLGAGRWTVFRSIVLPQLKPALLAGGVLVFSRSIAEFGATIVVVSAVLRTAPIKIYSEAEAGSLELASAYSVVLMVVSFAVYLIMRRWLLRADPETLGRE